MDASFPPSFSPVIQTIFLVGPDHILNLVAHTSITSIIDYVDSTPAVWSDKRQRSITPSTYAAEFSALRTATEEAQSIYYIVYYLNCNIICNRSSPV